MPLLADLKPGAANAQDRAEEDQRNSKLGSPCGKRLKALLRPVHVNEGKDDPGAGGAGKPESGEEGMHCHEIWGALPWAFQ